MPAWFFNFSKLSDGRVKIQV